MDRTMSPLSTDPTHNPLERLARRRAHARLGWYTHACVYVLVNLVLVAISSASGRNWAIFPALGWGLGLAIHGTMVFVLAGGTDLHERMVQAERDRIARSGRGS